MYKYLSVMVFLLLPVQLLGSERPRAIELLDRYAQNQNALNKSVIIKMERHAKLWLDGKKEVDRMEPIEVRLDGPRLFSCVNYMLKDPNSEFFQPTDNNTPLDESDFRNIDVWNGEYFLKYYDSPDYSWGTKRKQNIADIILMGVYGGSPLFGVRFLKTERIDNLLRQYPTLSVRSGMEAINSEPCYVIDAEDRTTEYTVWLNPKYGYGVCQAVIMHGPGTVGARTGRIIPENMERTCTLKDVRFRQMGQIYVPVSYSIDEKTRIDGVVTKRVESNTKVTDIVFNPDHEALQSFVPKIRDSATIEDKDTGLRYIWKEGH